VCCKNATIIFISSKTFRESHAKSRHFKTVIRVKDIAKPTLCLNWYLPDEELNYDQKYVWIFVSSRLHWRSCMVLSKWLKCEWKFAAFGRNLTPAEKKLFFRPFFRQLLSKTRGRKTKPWLTKLETAQGCQIFLCTIYQN
jgi:hypothetical protein